VATTTTMRRNTQAPIIPPSSFVLIAPPEVVIVELCAADAEVTDAGSFAIGVGRGEVDGSG
jgi:hypothetical protein